MNNHLSESAALEWQRDDPPFEIPEFANLGFDKERLGKVSASDMSRHFIFLGGTGSGKTKSGVGPVLRAGVKYQQTRPDLRAAMLVIDPKHDLMPDFLAPALKGQDKERLVVLDVRDKSWRIDFLEDKRGKGKSYADLMTSVLRFFAPEAIDGAEDGGQNAFWMMGGRTLVQVLVPVYAATVAHENTARRLSLLLDAENKYTQLMTYHKDNFFLSFSNWLAALSMFAADCFPYRGEAKTETWKKFEDELRNYVHSELKYPTKEDPTDLSAVFCLAGEHLADMAQMASASLGPIITSDFNERICINLIEAAPNCVNILEKIEDGKVIYFAPDRNPMDSEVTVGKALKRLFFVGTMNRESKSRPCIYVCDEAQRFITADAETGEQNYLDRCRAFRGICVLATQSIVSMQDKLLSTLRVKGASDSQVAAALGVIMANIGSQFYFRFTDTETVDMLKKLLPLPPTGDSNKRHVVDVRPAAMLMPGECYYMLSNAKWGRRQIPWIPVI